MTPRSVLPLDKEIVHVVTSSSVDFQFTSTDFLGGLEEIIMHVFIFIDIVCRAICDATVGCLIHN